MKAEVKIVKVSPKMAEELLTTQVKEQRHLRDTWVKSLATDMSKGDFRLSADALVVIKGALANGQHRLWAVIESNTTQPFLMMETDDDELYKVLDCGLRRTVADAAHITNGAAVCAAATLILGYNSDNLTQYSYKKRIQRIDQLEFVQKHSEKLQEVNAFVRNLSNRTQNLMPQSVAVTLVMIAEAWYGSRGLQFIELVYTGGDKDSAAHDLRERLIRMRMDKGAAPSQYYLAIVIKSFNSFVQGTRIATLRLTESEGFPKLRNPNPNKK